MNEYKIYRAAFNAVLNFDPKKGSLADTINKALSDCGLPSFINSSVEVDNKSVPAFDTQDFDDISSSLSDLGIDD